MSKNFVQRIVSSAWVRLSLATLITIGGMFPVLQTMRVQAAPDPTVFYVSVTGSVYGDGLSWETAYSGDRLQEAIDHAPSGSQVWVAAGTYYPTKEVGGTGDRYRSFQMKNGVAIYGGFPANPVNGIGMEARDWELNRTILSGDLGQDDIPGDLAVNRNDNAYHVFNHPEDLALDATAVLDGFTITGGNASVGNAGGMVTVSGSQTLSHVLFTENQGHLGGGMMNQASSPHLLQVTFSRNTSGLAGGGIYNMGGSHLYLTNVIIEDNHAVQSGGGLSNHDSVTDMNHVTISGNTAGSYSGGGIYSTGNLTLEDVTIQDNSIVGANTIGGGVAIFGSVMKMTRVTVEGNKAGRGAGIFISAGNTTLQDVTVIGNSAELTGGGLAVTGSTAMTNVTISGNTAGTNGGGLFVTNSNSTLTNVTISGNTSLGSGGGIFSTNSDLVMENVTINENSSKVSGGGLFLQSAKTNPESTMLTNNLITGNKAAGGGGGLFIDQAGPILTNVTISGNTASTGGGIYGNNSTSSARNSIIWGNTASDGQNLKANESNHTFSHSLIEGSGGSGDGWNAAYGTDNGGNIDANPGFMDARPAGEAPTSAGDYRLTDVSPAIDAGDGNVYEDGATPDLSAVTSDLADGPRKRYDEVDMGAYELLDEVDPAITVFSPASGEEDVPLDSVLELKFREPVRAVAGKAIKIWKADDTLAASVDAAETITEQAYGTSASIRLPSNLQYGAGYYVTMDKGAFIDRAGHEIAAISGKSAWTFSTVPATTVVLTATAGNRQVGLSWNAIPEAASYEVYQRLTSGTYDDTPVATVTDAVYRYTATGLTNGTTYHFKVRAMNAGEEVTVSNEASATPRSGSDSSTPEQPTTPQDPQTRITGVDVLVNGKVENAGTATTSNRNGQTVITVTMDQTKLEDKLAAEGHGAVVTIPVDAESDVVVGELNGQMVKTMEDKQAVLEIKTDRATYTLPAGQINIGAVSDQIGKSVALEDIKVQIEIAALSADTVKVVENAAAKGTFTLVVPPLDFTVRATYGDTVIEVAKFNAYVERTIAIPDGVDPSRITTGVVIEPDGTVRHVPTKVIQIDGKYYAKINSLTNSTYTVVWHTLEFGDVANHWAKDAVNDMGSRMVIDGVGGGFFHPDRDITRAEFAAIIVRALGLQLENGASTFSDVKEFDWFSSAINTAQSYNLINGFEDGTFRPNDKITREQAMVILSKAMAITGLKAKLPAPSADAALFPYMDAADVSAWSQSSIVDGLQAGIVSGRSGTVLAPKDYITRAEVAVMVRRLLQKSDLI